MMDRDLSKCESKTNEVAIDYSNKFQVDFISTERHYLMNKAWIYFNLYLLFKDYLA
jgi:hypothetical protein